MKKYDFIKKGVDVVWRDPECLYTDVYTVLECPEICTADSVVKISNEELTEEVTANELEPEF